MEHMVKDAFKPWTTTSPFSCHYPILRLGTRKGSSNQHSRRFLDVKQMRRLECSKLTPKRALEIWNVLLTSWSAHTGSKPHAAGDRTSIAEPGLRVNHPRANMSEPHDKFSKHQINFRNLPLQITSSDITSKEGNLTEELLLSDWPVGHILDRYLMLEDPLLFQGRQTWVIQENQLSLQLKVNQ